MYWHNAGNSATSLPLPWQQWQSRHGSKKKKRKKRNWVTAATTDTVKLCVVKELHANKQNGFVCCSFIRASARCGPSSRCSAALTLKKPQAPLSIRLPRSGKIWFSWGSDLYHNRFLSRIRTQKKIHSRLWTGTVELVCSFNGLFCVRFIDFDNKSIANWELDLWN